MLSAGARVALWCCCSAAVLLAPRQVRAATVSVSASGPQAAPCDSPAFSSIPDAIAALGTGDFIRVCDGTYGGFQVPAAKTPMTIQSVNGASVTKIAGPYSAGACYGIVVGMDTKVPTPISNFTLDGFELHPSMTPPVGGSDCAALVSGDAAPNTFVKIINNVVHDVLAPGTSSCRERFGCVGFALNGNRHLLVENNEFYSINNIGCEPNDVMRPDMSATQIIFASGEQKGKGYATEPITIRGNTIRDSSGLNALGIRVKRTTTMTIEGNTIQNLVGTDATADFPSRSRAIHPMGESNTDPIPGTNIQISGNVAIDTDIGVFVQDVNNAQLTGNDFTRTSYAGGVLQNSQGVDACGNIGDPPYVIDDTPGANPTQGGTLPCTGSSENQACPGTPPENSCQIDGGSANIDDSSQASTPGGMNVETIVGIVIGSVFLLVIGGVIVFFFVKKRKGDESQSGGMADSAPGGVRDYGATTTTGAAAVNRRDDDDEDESASVESYFDASNSENSVSEVLAFQRARPTTPSREDQDTRPLASPLWGGKTANRSISSTSEDSGGEFTATASQSSYTPGTTTVDDA